MVPLSNPIRVSEGQPRGSDPPAPRNRLTKKESELLALLRSNPGECLSRNFLLRTVWGYDEGTRTRTLDVHIQRLRRKLGPQAAAQILTIFRSGYCWRPDGEGQGHVAIGAGWAPGNGNGRQ